MDKIFYFVGLNQDCLEHLLFAGYLVLFAWFITKIKFFTNSGLTKAQLILLFLLKVMAGIFYGWVGAYYGQMAQMIDTWGYHVESLDEYRLLVDQPGEFFSNFFRSNYERGYEKFFSTENSWWNDIKGTFLIKIMALFNVASFGHYYVNVIFICFLTFFGPVAVYRVMSDVFPNKKMQVLLATFLIPSFLYWTSGLHKEGLIFMGLALMIYHFYMGFRDGSFGMKRILNIILGFLLVLILRNFLIITLVPPLLAWLLAVKFKKRPLLIFGATAVLFIVFFFTARYLHPALDFPQATVNKHLEFRKLGGGSAVEVKTLEPRFGSFLTNTPQALSLSMLRPYPSDVKHLLSLAAALEINLILLLFLIFLVWRKNGKPISPFLLFCLFLSFGILMMIGYTVNILGAIVRYRSIILPFLVIPMIALTNWKRVFQLISGNMIENNNVTKSQGT